MLDDVWGLVFGVLEVKPPGLSLVGPPLPPPPPPQAVRPVTTNAKNKIDFIEFVEVIIGWNLARHVLEAIGLSYADQDCCYI